MTRHFPTPLKLDCSGLSRKRKIELADLLVPHFDCVESWDDDELVAISPFNEYHYGRAWDIIDRYGVAWR